MLLAAAIVALASPAFAQAEPPAEEETPKDRAREHFAKGITLFAEENWDAALAEFLASRALFSTRNATKNAAICLRQLHRFDEALDMFEGLLREFPDLPAEARALVDKEIKNLQPLVGTIELRGAESGAAIVIDNRRRGATPSTPIRVSVGTHVVRVVKDGYSPFEAQVQIASGQAAVVEAKLRLIEQAGRLRVIEVDGKIADVIVDGVVVGKTPWEGSLPVGEHAVALDGEGDLGAPPTRATVLLGMMTPSTMKLETLDARLRIEPTPATARVSLDGVVLGRGLWEGKIRSGAHRLDLSADEHFPLAREIAVPRGERTVVPVALTRDPKTTLTFIEAEAARRAWIDRRGSALGFELRAQGILLITGNESVPAGSVVTGVSPTSGPYTRDSRVPRDDFGGGGAGGVGVRASYLYLFLPDPTVASTWSALRVGTGVDANFGYWYTLGSTPTATTASGPPADNQTTTKFTTGAWGTGWMFNIPVTLGYQVGLGSFKAHQWSGVALGLAYTPSFTVLLPSNADATSGLRLAAFEASIDFLDNPMQSRKRAVHGKFFVYTLFPVGNAPLIMNFGGGATWY